MNAGQDKPVNHEPLTPEERDLAQRLSRLGPSAGPSSNVDAAILAAAHDAVASAPRQRLRTRRRWPIALGVAASLMLAVGIAWRLRPLPEAAPVYDESAETGAARGSGPSANPPRSPSVARAVAADAISAPPKPAPAPETESAQASDSAAFAKRSEGKTLSKSEAAPAQQEPPIVVDEARATDVPAPAAPAFVPPPPPQAAKPAASSTSAAGALDSAPTMQPAEIRSRSAVSESRKDAQRQQSIADQAQDAAAAAAASEASDSAGNMEIVGADNGDEPPAYANSPEVRDAWLQRIRELIAEGDLQQASDSLHEFQRRYPGQPLPEDLHKFKQAKHDPAVP